MEIEYYGANCFLLKTKNANIVVDDNLDSIGGKSIQKDNSVAIFTNRNLNHGKNKSRLVIDSPGEFEIGDVTVKGLQTRSHMDNDNEATATVFQFMYANQSVTVLGHIHHDLASDVSELIGGTDVLVVPIGGNGYTLDPIGAASVIKSVEPETVILSHFDIKGLNYEVPAKTLEEFSNTTSMSTDNVQDSFKLAKSGEGEEQTQVIVLKVNK